MNTLEFLRRVQRQIQRISVITDLPVSKEQGTRKSKERGGGGRGEGSEGFFDPNGLGVKIQGAFSYL